jgi:hypothetical protein
VNFGRKGPNSPAIFATSLIFVLGACASGPAKREAQSSEVPVTKVTLPDPPARPSNLFLELSTHDAAPLILQEVEFWGEEATKTQARQWLESGIKWQAPIQLACSIGQSLHASVEKNDAPSKVPTCALAFELANLPQFLRIFPSSHVGSPTPDGRTRLASDSLACDLWATSPQRAVCWPRSANDAPTDQLSPYLALSAETKEDLSTQGMAIAATVTFEPLRSAFRTEIAGAAMVLPNLPQQLLPETLKPAIRTFLTKLLASIAQECVDHLLAADSARLYLSLDPSRDAMNLQLSFVEQPNRSYLATILSTAAQRAPADAPLVFRNLPAQVDRAQYFFGTQHPSDSAILESATREISVVLEENGFRPATSTAFRSVMAVLGGQIGAPWSVSAELTAASEKEDETPKKIYVFAIPARPGLEKILPFYATIYNDPVFAKGLLELEWKASPRDRARLHRATKRENLPAGTQWLEVPYSAKFAELLAKGSNEGILADLHADEKAELLEATQADESKAAISSTRRKRSLWLGHIRQGDVHFFLAGHARDFVAAQARALFAPGPALYSAAAFESATSQPGLLSAGVVNGSRNAAQVVDWLALFKGSPLVAAFLRGAASASWQSHTKAFASVQDDRITWNVALEGSFLAYAAIALDSLPREIRDKLSSLAKGQ